MKTPVSHHSAARLFDRLRPAVCGLLVRRCLSPIAILLAASCGRPAPVESSAEPLPEPVATFDPNSAENTLVWAAEIMLAGDAAPADPRVLAPPPEGSRRALKSMEGKEVRWLMRVHEVTAADECWLAPVRVSRPARPGSKGRWFALTAGRPSPDGVGFFSTTANFPTSPPNAAWVRAARKGDRVVLVGRVVEAHHAGGELLVAVDGHVEMP